jgi:hypothetical protein
MKRYQYQIGPLVSLLDLLSPFTLIVKIIGKVLWKRVKIVGNYNRGNTLALMKGKIS